LLHVELHELFGAFGGVCLGGLRDVDHGARATR
jgi:hypothetical protein